MGNKCDMEHERVVASQRGQQLSDQLGESVGHNVKSSPGGVHSKEVTFNLKWGFFFWIILISQLQVCLTLMCPVIR